MQRVEDKIQKWNLSSPTHVGVYGTFDLHGRPRAIHWTTLAATMTKGSSNLTLSDDVEGIWFPGDEIVVATTAQDSNQTERFVIESVNGTVVTVTNVSEYRHIGKNSFNPIYLTDICDFLTFEKLKNLLRELFLWEQHKSYEILRLL